MTIPKISSYNMPVSMPENRVDWLPEAGRAALLIHDMQDYFIDFYDRDAAPIPSLMAHVLQLRAACDALGIPVFYSAQPAQQDPSERGLLQDWWGPGLTAKPERAAIVPQLKPAPHHTVLTKWRYSAFVRSDFLQQMRTLGRDQLMVCGVYAHIGCLMTCADAFMNDIQPFMIGDALADFSVEQHQMGLDYVAQRCGVVISSARALNSLQASRQSAAPALVSTSAANSELPHSLEQLQAQVAALLMVTPDDLPFDENLVYCGLDSIRLMSLVERWNRAGLHLNFTELAQRTTLSDWWQLLQMQLQMQQTAGNDQQMGTVA